MAKIHHTTLKAAVVKYGGLIAEGKSPEEIKAAIAADQKAFDQTAIDDIYDAILEKEAEGDDSTKKDPDEKQDYNVKTDAGAQSNSNGKKGSFKVLTEFRDIDNFAKVHAVGSDVSHFKKERLEKLVALGYISGK